MPEARQKVAFLFPISRDRSWSPYDRCLVRQGLRGMLESRQLKPV